MSLRIDVTVIFSLRARNMCIAKDSTQSHTSKYIFGVGTHSQLRKRPQTVRDLMNRATVELVPSLDPARMT
jgi:hypothetical protein